jgi:hypothetical protein
MSILISWQVGRCANTATSVFAVLTLLLRGVERL